MDRPAAGGLHPAVPEHLLQGSGAGQQGDVQVEDENVWQTEQDGDLPVTDIDPGGLHQEETEPAGVTETRLHGTALPDCQGGSVTRLQQECQSLS